MVTEVTVVTSRSGAHETQKFPERIVYYEPVGRTWVSSASRLQQSLGDADDRLTHSACYYP